MPIHSYLLDATPDSRFLPGGMQHPASPLGPEALELVAARFRVLGESSRLRLLQILRAGERNVSSLVAASGLAQANASRHLQTLADAGIVGRRRDGQSVVYYVADPAIFELCEHVCGSVRRRIDAHSRAFAGAARPPARASRGKARKPAAPRGG